MNNIAKYIYSEKRREINMQETKHIKYTSGYKYILEDDVWFFTNIYLTDDFHTNKIIHYKKGWMLIMKGFGWDGPSGITHDDKYNMRGALIHDAGYYLLRHNFNTIYRGRFDTFLKRVMKEDADYLLRNKKFTMLRKLFFNRIRPAYYKFAVKMFGKSSADPENKRKILIAP